MHFYHHCYYTVIVESHVDEGLATVLGESCSGPAIARQGSLGLGCQFGRLAFGGLGYA